MIHYHIKPSSPEAHILEIRLLIQEPSSEGQILYLPAWIRGSYMVRDFARNIVTISASSDNESVELIKQDKQTWKAAPVDGSLLVTYQVYAWDLSVRAAHVDTTHAYFNGPSVFLGVAGCEKQPCHVEVARPNGKKYRQWRLAYAMPSITIDQEGFGTFQAEDYEALLDCPAEMGEFSETSFVVNECPHRLFVNGKQSMDMDRIRSDLVAICREEVELFGELPIQNYLFLLWVVGDGYGGLEHRNSTSLMISRRDLPTKSMEEMSKGYRRLLGLCSHEYFHLWNVKRITPEVFQMQGTEREVYTRQLWVFEGITSYYDELILVRSGVIDRRNYFEMMAETVTRVMRGSGRHKQTLEASSFDAWTKFYKQDENAPNAIVSYYAKGALLALLLDLTIRLRSEGKFSLDDVMRLLWQRHGKTNMGLPEGGFEALVDEVTGLDFKEFFDLGVRSTDDLPLEEALREFGVELHLLPAKSSSDNGGVVEARSKSTSARSVLGAKWQQKGPGIFLQQVFDDGAAQKAGLSAGDEIVAVDGVRMDASDMEHFIAHTPAGDSLTLHIFRRDVLMQFEVSPLPVPPDTCYFYLPEKIDDAQRIRRDAWLQGYARRH
ncbi:MAG: PDZ domain-containing protein [Candidatus Thiodiazotropha sp. (ex Myrtea sp. 'scaly one' KF741663)]|nr:PDZ domain-containing protein [Candidatus Thiodiazotropha sp. (ex Myrtea sp. 'scaly one' KF741663)]